MKQKFQKYLLVLSLALIIICGVIVTISPRFGRSIDGIDSRLQSSKYILEHIGSNDDSTNAVYVNCMGEFIVLSYSSRFFGDITVIVDDEKSVTMKGIKFDGSYSGETNNNAESTSEAYSKFNSSAYSIISNDSGAFYLFQYLKPIFFIGLSTFFMKKSFKTESEKVELTFHFLATVSCLVALLFAFRII